MAHHTARAVAAAVVVAAIAGSAPLLTVPAGAAARATSVTCVVKDANDCVVTLSNLTSNMSEQLTSTMPDHVRAWYLHLLGGVTGKGGYEITESGWDGHTSATTGHVWSALFSTGTVEAGDDAVLTFSHVKAAPARHYRSFTYSYTSKAFTGGTVTISDVVVTPVPPKGHLLVQRLDGRAWKNVLKLTYSAKAKSWSGHFAWPYPKHTTHRYRLLALAAPGLLTTAGPSFTISTAS